MASLGKERRRLADVVLLGTALRRADEELAGARELADADDQELAAMARADVQRLEPEIAAFEARLKPLLIPRDPLADRPAIVEIRAGTGGD